MGDDVVPLQEKIIGQAEDGYGVSELSLVERSVNATAKLTTFFSQEINNLNGEDRERLFSDLGVRVPDKCGFPGRPERGVIIRIKNSNPLRIRMSYQQIKLNSPTGKMSNCQIIENYIYQIGKKLEQKGRDQDDTVFEVDRNGPRTRLDLDLSDGKGPCVVVFDCRKRFAGFFGGTKAERCNLRPGDPVRTAILGDHGNSDGDPLYQAILVRKRPDCGSIIRTVMSYCDASQKTGKYGIGLNLTDLGLDEHDDPIKFQTGIIIDPKVKNDG